MSSEYLIVSKSVLPDYFEKVIEARDLLRSGKVREVSEAVRIVGISRSTYYKYKDHVFHPSEDGPGKRAVFSMMLSHKKGTLGRVLNVLSNFGANILTITQNPPLGGRASVVISMDVTNLTADISDLINVLGRIPGVENPSLIDMA